MSQYRFLYVAPDETIKENTSILPIDALRRIEGDQSGIIFRFCINKQDNKLYIQDESFRQRLNDGNSDAWRILNHCLRAMSKDGIRYLEQDFGDPENSGIFRRLSDYKEAWEDLRASIQKEFGVEPINMPVYEYIAKAGDGVSILSKGTLIDGEPTPVTAIGINRKLHKESRFGLPDVSEELLGTVLRHFYLTNIKSILKETDGPASKWLQERLEPKDHTMVAIRDENRTRIFKPKDTQKMMDEPSLRNSLGYKGPIILFSFDKNKNRLVIYNHVLGVLLKDERTKAMLEDIVSSAAKVSKTPKHKITLSFDPSLRQPFKSKLSKYRLVWQLSEHRPENDIDVLEVPFEIENGSIVANNEAEEEKIPNMRMFRAARGIQATYPLMIVSNLQPVGRKIRSLIDTFLGFSGKPLETHDDQIKFAMELRLKPVRAKVKADMEYLLAIGLDAHDALDFFATENELFKRAEYRKIMDEILEPPTKRKVVASLGMGLQINDWFVGSQEALNRAQHQNSPENKKTKPFNLNKKTIEIGPRSYEQLLRSKHDKDLSSQKSIEQLLRESQI